MRRLVATLALLVAAACGGDSSTAPPAPSPGSLTFRVDAQTCTGTSVVSFFVDGATVGSQSMTAGSTSQAFSVTAGTHIVGARVAASGYTWPSQTITVGAGQPFTMLLTCT